MPISQRVGRGPTVWDAERGDLGGACGAQRGFPGMRVPGVLCPGLGQSYSHPLGPCSCFDLQRKGGSPVLAVAL